MSVYVDDMRATFGRMVMCHMVADSRAELLSMADRIGVPHRWLQKAGTHREHFDICMAKRKQAVAAGAIEITQRELAVKCRERAAKHTALTRHERESAMQSNSILIVGPQGSGKTTMARKQAEKIGRTVEIAGGDFLGGFAFSDCDAGTKCVVVEGADPRTARRILDRVKTCTASPHLRVNRKYQESFEIETPRFIVTMDAEVLDSVGVDLSQLRHFNVIHVVRSAA